MSDTPEHSREPQLTALLFCREVIIEKDDMLSPFRIVEAAEIPISSEPADITLWQNVQVKLLIGVSCYGLNTEHQHSIKLKIFQPNGERMAEKDRPVLVKGSSSSVYKDVALVLPGNVAGRYLFEALLDGKLAGSNFFTVRHKYIDPSAKVTLGN